LTAVVAAILFATGTGAAAAATGTNGPLGVLHRILFGGHHSTAPDPAIARARALLDDAERRISAAAAAGHISRADRQTIAGELGQAADLMRGVTDRADALWQRLAELRHQLAALPTADPGRASAPTTPATGHQSTQPSPATPDDPTQSAAPAPTTRAAQSGEPDSGGQSHDRNERSRSGAGQGSDGEGQDADKQGGDNGDDSQQGEDNSDDRATSDTSSNVPGEDDQDGD
jgi:hypothetical protein